MSAQMVMERTGLLLLTNAKGEQQRRNFFIRPGISTPPAAPPQAEAPHGVRPRPRRKNTFRSFTRR